MYRETLPEKQMAAWLAAASPVVIQFAADSQWWPVALIAVVALVAVRLVWKWGSCSRWTVIPSCVLLIIYVGQILQASAEIWPGNSYPAVPLFLLGLALWSAWKGASAAARAGCVLFWLVLIVYPAVFGAALQDVRWEWVEPKEGAADGNVLLLLLLPVLSGILLKKGTGSSKKLLLPSLFAVVCSILTAGILSRPEEDGFYQMVRSIDLLGVVKHFEALISATATVGWFALLSWTLSICGGAGELIAGKGKTFVIAGAVGAAIWMLCELHIHIEILAVSTAVFWVLVPILAQGLERVKKLKKSKIDP